MRHIVSTPQHYEIYLIYSDPVSGERRVVRNGCLYHSRPTFVVQDSNIISMRTYMLSIYGDVDTDNLIAAEVDGKRYMIDNAIYDVVDDVTYLRLREHVI